MAGECSACAWGCLCQTDDSPFQSYGSFAHSTTQEEAPQQVPQTPNPGLGSCAPEDLDEDLVIPYHDRMRCRSHGGRSDPIERGWSQAVGGGLGRWGWTMYGRVTLPSSSQ